jgi:dinuclear metal center YbgI/SA1388 family protein
MITTVNHILEALLNWAPNYLKADNDNIGLLVGNPNQTVNKIITCLDVTKHVIDEAEAANAQLIVAHHPLIFRKLASVRTDDPTGSLVTELVRREISLIAMHTNLDSAVDGVSYVLAEKMGLNDLSFLESGRDGGGYGVIGNLHTPVTKDHFLSLVAEALHVPMLRYSGHSNAISKVAVCGGAGSFLIETAINAGAHAFVTADLKYHDFFTHQGTFVLCDAGHYETEMPVCDRVRHSLQQTFPQLQVQVTRHVTNPVEYFIKHFSTSST